MLAAIPTQPASFALMYQANPEQPACPLPLPILTSDSGRRHPSLLV